VTDDQQRPPERPGPADQPEQPADQPIADQPTVGWTPPEQPTPAWTPTPPDAPPPPVPPVAEPAPPYSTGSGPLLSATPTATTGWAQAQAPDDRREIAPGLVFSSTSARFAAYVTDSFLLSLAGGLFTTTIGSGAAFNPSGGLVWTTGDFVSSILTVVINGAYFIAFWSGGRRATLGQTLFKIQVGNAFDGRPLSLEQAVRRWLGLGQFLGVFAVSVGAVGIIGVTSLIWTLALFITTISSPTKQGLHDRFANSAVVRPASAGNGLVYTCLIVFLAIPILAVLAILALIIVGAQTMDFLSTVGTSVTAP